MTKPATGRKKSAAVSRRTLARRLSQSQTGLIAGHTREQLETELVDVVVALALQGDLGALRFVLTNLFPSKWSHNPQPAVAPSVTPVVLDDDDDIPGAPPYRIRLLDRPPAAIEAAQ
jgi:hypothetical protein